MNLNTGKDALLYHRAIIELSYYHIIEQVMEQIL